MKGIKITPGEGGGAREWPLHRNPRDQASVSESEKSGNGLTIGELYYSYLFFFTGFWESIWALWFNGGPGNWKR